MSTERTFDSGNAINDDATIRPEGLDGTIRPAELDGTIQPTELDGTIRPATLVTRDKGDGAALVE